MTEMGRLLMFIGGGLFFVGLLIAFGGRLPWFGSLPGDITVQRGNFTLFMPITSMIVVSLLLTLVLNVIIRLFR